jgi:hypothetical protein
MTEVTEDSPVSVPCLTVTALPCLVAQPLACDRTGIGAVLPIPPVAHTVSNPKRDDEHRHHHGENHKEHEEKCLIIAHLPSLVNSVDCPNVQSPNGAWL